MNFKHVDMSFTAAGEEILSVSGITFDNSPFPYVYENIEKISILIDDDYETTQVVALNISIIIEKQLEVFRFNIYHNDLSSLFSFVDVSVQPVVISFDQKFQLKSVKIIPKEIHGLYKNNVNKPVKVSYDELGTIKALYYLDVDPNSSDMYYYDASCHTTPKSIVFNEFGEIDVEESYFSIHRKNTTFIVSNYKSHIELIEKITKKRAFFDIKEHKVRFENEDLSTTELSLIRLYYSFIYYKLKFNLDYKSKEDIFNLNEDEQMLISMLLF